MPTIYETLKQDHDKVKALLNQLIALPEDSVEEKSRLLEAIRDDLIPHSRAEEAVLYNSMRLVDESKTLAMHGYREHMEAETLLRTLQLGDKLKLNWKDTARKLKEALEHHIEDEEGEMFETAQNLFTEEEAMVMNDVFLKMKPQVQQEGFMKNTLDMVTNMMPPRLTDAVKDLVGSSRKY